MKTLFESRASLGDWSSIDDVRYYELDTKLLHKIQMQIFNDVEVQHSINIAKQLTGIGFTEEQIKAINVLFRYWKEQNNKTY